MGQVSDIYLPGCLSSLAVFLLFTNKSLNCKHGSHTWLMMDGSYLQVLSCYVQYYLLYFIIVIFVAVYR